MVSLGVHRSQGSSSQGPPPYCWAMGAQVQGESPQASSPLKARPWGTPRHPFPSCEQWPPLPGGRAHRPFLPSRLALVTPQHPFPKLTWTVPRDGGPRAEPTSFARSVWGAQASPGAEPTGWAWLAVLPRRGPRDGQEKACRSNAMANHRGASRRDTSTGPFQITGLRPALPT